MDDKLAINGTKDSGLSTDVSEGQQASTKQIASKLFCKEDVMKAEILWCVRTIATHSSYKSNENCGDMFRSMIPDSLIAKQYQCGERKSAYVTSFGIAPYLQNKLKEQILQEKLYVLLFDESMNRKNQEKQLDFHIRFWNHDMMVRSHYFTSTFLGHARAEDLLASFTTCTEKLPKKGLVQLSMDGPSVNWKFYKEVRDELHTHQDCHDMSMINTGSCGLHIVHNAYKNGIDATGWSLDHLLLCMYQLLKDSPARRDDYRGSVTSGLAVFPLKYCKTRWIENVPVIERAIDVLPGMKAYVNALSDGKYPNPGTKSFNAVNEATKDVLTLAKLQFALSVTKQVVPFLQFYQTDKPVLAFMAEDLYVLLKNIMIRFIKAEVMNAAKTIDKLLKVKVSDNESLSPHDKIDVGFVADKNVKEMLHKKIISDKKLLEFRMECRACLQTIVQKLLDKSPIQYVLVRKLSCLDPRKMFNSKELYTNRMRDILHELLSVNRVRGDDCDEILSQFQTFMDEYASSSDFKHFDVNKDRLNVLYYERMQGQRFAKFWAVYQLLQLLSHGLASVERGFSINREIETENLAHESYIAQRVICDHVHAIGGILNFRIDKDLMLSVAGARQKYMMYLDDQKRATANQAKGEKRKSLLDEVDEIKRQKTRLESDAKSLEKDADKLAEKAESSGQLTLIAKSNSLRRTVKDKKAKLKELCVKLDAKLEELKNS